jgi:hypothetical protein
VSTLCTACPNPRAGNSSLGRNDERSSLTSQSRSGFSHDLIEPLKRNRFLKYRPRSGRVRRKFESIAERGEEKNAGRRVLAQNISTSGQAVEAAHGQIHQHDVRFVAAIGTNRIKTGVDDVDDFVTTATHHFRQHLRESFFIVGNKDAHAICHRSFRARASKITGIFRNAERGATFAFA